MYYILVLFWVTTFWHKLPKAIVHTYCMYSTSQISHDIIQYDTLRLFPSKGNEPLTRVYRMTPRLQTSTSGPSYFLPWNSSGAAYGGLPQNVSSLLPGVNSLLNPKSAILMFMLESSSRFSAYGKRNRHDHKLQHISRMELFWSQLESYCEIYQSDILRARLFAEQAWKRRGYMFSIVDN